MEAAAAEELSVALKAAAMPPAGLAAVGVSSAVFVMLATAAFAAAVSLLAESVAAAGFVVEFVAAVVSAAAVAVAAVSFAAAAEAVEFVAAAAAGQVSAVATFVKGSGVVDGPVFEFGVEAECYATGADAAEESVVASDAAVEVFVVAHDVAVETVFVLEFDAVTESGFAAAAAKSGPASDAAVPEVPVVVSAVEVFETESVAVVELGFEFAAAVAVYVMKFAAVKHGAESAAAVAAEEHAAAIVAFAEESGAVSAYSAAECSVEDSAARPDPAVVAHLVGEPVECLFEASVAEVFAAACSAEESVAAV